MQDEPDSESKAVGPPSAGFRPVTHEVVGGVLVIALAGASLWLSELGAFVAPLVLAGGVLVLIGIRQHRSTAIVAGALLLSSPIVVYLVSIALLFALVTKQTVIPQAEWSSALSLVASDTAAAATDVEAVSMGGFIDTANVWRLPVNPANVEQAARDLEAHEILEAQVPADFWDSFPSGMRPPRSLSNRYFISQDFPVDGRGGDGDHHLAMYDPSGRMLYVLEISNF